MPPRTATPPCSDVLPARCVAHIPDGCESCQRDPFSRRGRDRLRARPEGRGAHGARRVSPSPSSAARTTSSPCPPGSTTRRPWRSSSITSPPINGGRADAGESHQQGERRRSRRRSPGVSMSFPQSEMPSRGGFGAIVISFIPRGEAGDRAPWRCTSPARRGCRRAAGGGCTARSARSLRHSGCRGRQACPRETGRSR